MSLITKFGPGTSPLQALLLLGLAVAPVGRTPLPSTAPAAPPAESPAVDMADPTHAA